MSVTMLLAGATPPTQLAPVLNVVAVFPQTIVVARITKGDPASIKPAHKAPSSLRLSRWVGAMAFMSSGVKNVETE